jgi:hypothetical protein
MLSSVSTVLRSRHYFDCGIGIRCGAQYTCLIRPRERCWLLVPALDPNPGRHGTARPLWSCTQSRGLNTVQAGWRPPMAVGNLEVCVRMCVSGGSSSLCRPGC